MNKNTITAVCFIAVTIIISVGSVFNNKDYILNNETTSSFNEKVSHVFGENNIFSAYFIELWSLVNSNNTADISLIEDAQYGNLIKDEKGYLYFPANKLDVSSYADKLYELSKKANNFIYIQAPNKVVDGYTNRLVYNYNFANENADDFLRLISEKNIDSYDLRSDLKEAGEFDDMFYKTDHHWKTPTAFWAYTKIVDVINNKYNLHIDDDYFYRDINNFKIQNFDDYFLGALGRRTGKAISGLDDYTFIEPNFDTNFELYNMLSSDYKDVSNGPFSKTIKINKILSDPNVETNKYASYFEWDYGYLRVVNTKINNGAKILLIKDSYALPFAAFLSTCVSELDMIDLRDTPKANLDEILSQNQYDLVMVLYNTESFTNQMFSF